MANKQRQKAIAVANQSCRFLHPDDNLYFQRHEVRDRAETSCWSDAFRLFFPHTALCVAVLFP